MSVDVPKGAKSQLTLDQRNKTVGELARSVPGDRGRRQQLSLALRFRDLPHSS